MKRTRLTVPLLAVITLFGIFSGPTAKAAPLPGDAPFVKLLIAVTTELASRDPNRLNRAPGQLRQLEGKVATLVEGFEKNPAVLISYLKAGFRPEPFLFSRLRSRFAFAVTQESKKQLQPALEMLENTGESPLPSGANGFPGLIAVPGTGPALMDIAANRLTILDPMTPGRSPERSAFQKGSLIVSRRELSPESAFLARVTEVTTGPGRVEMTTEPVFLEDLLAAGPGCARSLTAEDIDSVSSSETATGSRTVWDKIKKSAVFTTGVSFGVNNEGLLARGEVIIQDPVLVFSHEEISFRGKLLLNTVTGFKPSKSFRFKHPFFTVALNPVLLGFAGPVPIYVRPRFKFYVEGSVRAAVGCTWIHEMVAPFQVGVKKQGGEWVNTSTSSVESKTPGLKFNGNIGSVNGGVSVGVSTFFPINDIAGPQLEVEANSLTTSLLTVVKKSGIPPTPFLSQMDTTVGIQTSIGGAVRFLKKARFSVTIGSIDLPLHSLAYAGFRLDPERVSLRQGEPFRPERVTIVPKYTETVLNEEKQVRELFPLPSTCGVWKFQGREIGPEFVAPTPGVTNLECVLNLLKASLSGKSAGLVLETAE